ncbi:MAG: hypothetical protein J6E38_01790 [Clostridia bacterium]|nr:hypothetical protein [Clostridia bacterium]
MIELNLVKMDNFWATTEYGVLYLKIPVPFNVHCFTPLDIYKHVKIHIAGVHDVNVVETIYAEVVEIVCEEAKQYIIVREIPAQAMQQFEECCM